MPTTTAATSWRDKGDLDRAMADYSEAIKLSAQRCASLPQPRLRLFLYGRLHGGRRGPAARQRSRGQRLPNLWRYLARGRLKQDGAAELGANAARLKSKDWPYAVIDFYLDRRSLAEMRAAAGKPEEKCEAEFYIGEWHLLRGNTADARTALQAAVDTCPKDFVEYAGAVAELKRLKP